jgi:hypothetical protein
MKQQLAVGLHQQHQGQGLPQCHTVMTVQQRERREAAMGDIQQNALAGKAREQGGLWLLERLPPIPATVRVLRCSSERSAALDDSMIG